MPRDANEVQLEVERVVHKHVAPVNGISCTVLVATMQTFLSPAADFVMTAFLAGHSSLQAVLVKAFCCACGGRFRSCTSLVV